MKVVPDLISFTSIYYLQKFEFGEASFGPFQNCVCLKKWLIKKPRCSYWAEPTAAAARTPNSPLLRAAGTRLATTSVVPGRCRPPVPLPCSSTWHPPPPHTGPPPILTSCHVGPLPLCLSHFNKEVAGVASLQFFLPAWQLEPLHFHTSS
jgi:hypothetical protein